MGKKIKMLRIDNGLDFNNGELKRFLELNGTKFSPCAPYCPQQQGRIEREMRTIVEAATSMLHSKNLPRDLWSEAINTAVYAINRTLSANNDEATPYELWHGRKPNVKHMHPFGSNAYVVNTDINRNLTPEPKSDC